MKDEVSTGYVISICLTWAALLLAFLITQSWEKVFLSVGILLGLGILACAFIVLTVLVFAPATQAIALREGITKFDERLDEIAKKIRSDGWHFDQCRDSIRHLEDAVEGLYGALKEDSKAIAKGSVNEAAEQIIDQI